jgi:phage terminase large subunit-like protein
MEENKSQHVADADQYARDVVADAIPGCKWTKAACQRQLDDLKRSKTDPTWPFYYDEEAADKICIFVELLPHIKGKWAGGLIKLEPWQKFILCTVFGWKHRETHLRRFTKAYVEVPRKNAKSTTSSGVGLYMEAADEEPGAEVYSAATTRDQAKIVFNVAQQMARRTAGLRKHYGVTVGSHAITVLETASKFEALSADAGTLDGLNVHCGIIDELHAHKTRHVYDVIETATGSRSQPLIWSITTAGSNRTGICYEIRTYITKILDNRFEDDTYFGIIYSIDDTDDWTDPAVWRKANPNFGISVNADDFTAKARKAQRTASALNNFLTKHLNVWVNADTAWLDVRDIDKCANPDLTIDDFEKQPCIWAGDLASKIDLAATVLLFRRIVSGKPHFYAFSKNYLPELAVEESDNSQYPGWVETERIVTTPGAIIDFEYIENDLKELRSRFQIVEVAYDPSQATQFSTRMAAEGFTMVELVQNVKNLSEPMKELEAIIIDGRFHFDGDPVLSWALSNVVCHRDAKDHIYPRKERPENKIDPAVALIMAVARWIFQPMPKGAPLLSVL